MKKIAKALLVLVLALCLLPGPTMALSWELEQSEAEVQPNRISSVSFSADAPIVGKKPSDTVVITGVEVNRGAVELAVEKVEWSGGFDQSGCFREKQDYYLTIGVRIVGCSDSGDLPRFTSAGEIRLNTLATLEIGEYTIGGEPSLQPTGDKQYIEFTVKIYKHYVSSASAGGGVVYENVKESPFSFAGGSGTKADPYLISTPDQLNAVRQGLDKHYKLANDIDLSAWGDWMPIGGEGVDRYGIALPFTGSFDGAGHVVSGMTITGSPFDYACEGETTDKFTPSYYGLFAYVKGSKTAVSPGDAYEDTTLNGISNLGVVNYTIDISFDGLTGNLRGKVNLIRAGAIAGKAENTRIVGCWSSGGAARVSPSGYAGGIVGGADNAAILECWNASALNSGSRAAGIAADMPLTWVSHCFNAGTLTGGDTFGIGYGYTSFPDSDEKRDRSGIMYCYNSGALSGNSAFGIGYADFMDNVYNAGSLNAADSNKVSQVFGNPYLSALAPPLGASNTAERSLTDGNWINSPALGRKVLVVLREDLLVSGAAGFAGSVGGFTDVYTGDFFADAVVWAVNRKITNGTDDSGTIFSPYDTCTKAQALTLIYRAEREPHYDPPADYDVRAAFSETNGEWFLAYYYASSCWAYGKGMITPTTYLHAPCTRADFVTYLWTAAGAPESAVTGRFTDVPSGAACAQAVAWAAANGITKGTNEAGTTFSPDDTCTRGEIVTFLYRGYQDK